MPGVIPATLRQLVLSQRLPIDSVAKFVLTQTREKLRHIDGAIASRSSVAGHVLLPHVRETLLTAVHEALAVNDASAPHAADDLHGKVMRLNKAIMTGIDVHRPTVKALKADSGSAHNLAELTRTFDCLQYNAIGMSVQLSSLTARYNGAAAPPVMDVALRPLVERTLDDVKAFSVEKFGVAPPVEVGKSESREKASFLGVPEYGSFALTELLKNAFRAHIERYGAAGVDDAPPIRIVIAADRKCAAVRVCDVGGGLPEPGPKSHFHYFSSTFVPLDAGWTYSREHGTPFTGLGLGLVRAQLHARFLGGGLSLLSQPGYGCDGLLWFDRAGDKALDFLPMRLR